VSLTIRDASPDDYVTFTRFFAQLGVPDDPVPTREKWSAMCAAAIFATDDRGAHGYSYASALDGIGYVFHVVVDEASRGRGVGRALMEEVARRFRAKGCTRWCLNVRRENAVAIRLYERCGMGIAYASTAMKIAWSRVEALAPPAERTESRVLNRDDDDEAERLFDLPAGRLDHMRKQGRLMLRVSTADGRIAVAAFDPAFPGAFPFRVATPALARPLFEAMRAHARPEHDYVRFVVEADAALEAAASRAGAEAMMEMFYMRGDLPIAAS
jgi:ribosomal protein S18 acetylase RimI-like enzyme